MLTQADAVWFYLKLMLLGVGSYLAGVAVLRRTQE